MIGLRHRAAVGPRAAGGCSAIAVVAMLAVSACGGGAAQTWRERPKFDERPPWHCVETGKGSFREPSPAACERAKRSVASRGNLVLSGATNCKPARTAVCFTYRRNPTTSSPSSRLQSVHDVATDDWTYDCSAARSTCQRAQESLLRDRTQQEEGTADVSPCDEM
jgi:hypothetical protein